MNWENIWRMEARINQVEHYKIDNDRTFTYLVT